MDVSLSVTLKPSIKNPICNSNLDEILLLLLLFIICC